MNILITNDDGISSNGILALEKVFRTKYRVFLIAPLRERSATSQALSVFDPMRVEKVSDDHYIVDGYPVDCVNIGLHGGIFPPIDVVLSGINHGQNMGHDVHYSGTVGAARHAAIHGRYAFALSSGNVKKNAEYHKEAELFLEYFEKHLFQFKKGIVYNINFPEKFRPDVAEFRLAKLGKRTYVDTYRVTNLVGNISDFSLGGSDLGYIDAPATDFHEYKNHHIPVTPIALDVTDYTEYNALKHAFGQNET